MNPFEQDQNGGEQHVPIEKAISDILAAQQDLEIFFLPGKEEKIQRLLTLAQDIPHTSDADLAELNALLRDMSVSIFNAQDSIKKGRAAFRVDDDPEHARLWGSRQIVMERTAALVAQKANVDAIKELAYSEASLRLERQRAAEERQALIPFMQEFEHLPREQVLETLVDLQDQMLEQSLERASEHASLDSTTNFSQVSANIDALDRVIEGLEKRIKAAKAVAAKKKKG